MAWALQFDGVNDYASSVNWTPASSDFSGEVKFSTTQTKASWSGLFSCESYNDDKGFALMARAGNLAVHILDGVGDKNPYTIPGATISDGVTHIAKLVCSSTETKVYLDGSLVYTTTRVPLLSVHPVIFGGRNANSGTGMVDALAYDLEYCHFVDDLTPANSRYFSATDSDHSNTGVQPVLVDTIGSNNATGAIGTFPTDGSAWVDLGGEPTLTPVTKSFTSTINLSEQVNKAFIANINLNERRSKEFLFTTNLLQKFKKNYAYVINLLSSNKVTKAFAFKLDLLQKQTTETQLLTNLLSKKTKTFSATLELLKRLEQTHTSQFDLIARKTLQHSGLVNFLGSKKVNFSAVVNLLARQNKTFIGEVDFYQKVNKSFTYQLDFLATGRASKSYSFQIDFMERLKKHYSSEINLLQRQGLSYQHSVDLLSRVTKDFSGKLNLLNKQTKNFTVTLDCIGRVGKTFNVVFNIESDNMPTTPAHYVVSVDHLIEFTDQPIQTIEFKDNPTQTLIV